MPVDLGEGLVEMRGGGGADVGDEVGEILGALELDLALDLRYDRVGVHGGLGFHCYEGCSRVRIVWLSGPRLGGCLLSAESSPHHGAGW